MQKTSSRFPRFADGNAGYDEPQSYEAQVDDLRGGECLTVDDAVEEYHACHYL